MLDEQSFQDMLAAAYTIQEHNAKRRRGLQPGLQCRKCGAPVQQAESFCQSCSLDEVRPGERLQQKWASMWLMSQEQSLSPGAAPDEGQVAAHDVENLPLSVSENVEETNPDTDRDEPSIHAQQADAEPPSPALWDFQSHSLDSTLLLEPELSLPAQIEVAADPAPPSASLAELRLKLRFHRADLFLVVAIIVSTFAMLWVLLATPAMGSQRKPRLRPWERAMISLGLADAPDPPAKRGNPSAQVWVDPKTALYYCYGDEQYGKTPGGHQAAQREAQLDSFEPAGRVACE